MSMVHAAAEWRRRQRRWTGGVAWIGWRPLIPATAWQSFERIRRIRVFRAAKWTELLLLFLLLLKEKVNLMMTRRRDDGWPILWLLLSDSESWNGFIFLGNCTPWRSNNNNIFPQSRPTPITWYRRVRNFTIRQAFATEPEQIIDFVPSFTTNTKWLLLTKRNEWATYSPVLLESCRDREGNDRRVPREMSYLNRGVRLGLL